MNYLSLPTVVACDIVCCNLSLKELVRLDSAFCCENRDVWSEQLQSKTFTLQAPVDLVDDKQLRWLLSRNVKSASVKFRTIWRNDGDLYEDFDERMLSNYWRSHGHCVHSVDSEFSDIESEVNFTVRHCRNLTSVYVEEATLSRTFSDLLFYNPSIQKLECYSVRSKRCDLFEGLSLHKLQTLKMIDCLVDKGSFWHDTAHSDSLHTVIWIDCSVEDADLRALATNCPNLKSFLCSNGAREGPCLLANHVSKLSRLINLSVAFDDSVTNADVLAIATHLTALRTLNIQRCDTLTDVSLLHVAEHLGNKLEMLYADVMNPESKETVQILQFFSQKCTKLTYLNIDCDYKVLCAGKGTSLLVRGCPALRTLVVESQKTICETSREFIATIRPDLQLLVDEAGTEYDILSMPI